MLFNTCILTGLIALAGFANAAPAPVTNATSPSYYLKAHVQHQKSNPPHSHFDGTYVQLYHTGAGTDDVSMTLNKSQVVSGFLNGTFQQFNLRGRPDNYIPFGMTMASFDYTDWNPVEINVGYGFSYGAFYLARPSDNGTAVNPATKPSGLSLYWNTSGNSSNPTFNATAPSNEFGGWMVCDWWHSVPQLFWLTRFRDLQYQIPAICETVDLTVEWATSG